jgi:hypothetical protein
MEFRVLKKKKKKKTSPCMSCDLNVDYNSLPLQQRIGRWEQNYLFGLFVNVMLNTYILFFLYF